MDFTFENYEDGTGEFGNIHDDNPFFGSEEDVRQDQSEECLENSKEELQFEDIHDNVPVFSSEQYYRQVENEDNTYEELQDQDNVLHENLIGDFLSVDGLRADIISKAEQYFKEKVKNESKLFLNEKYLESEKIKTETNKRVIKKLEESYENLKIDSKVLRKKAENYKEKFHQLEPQCVKLKYIVETMQESFNSYQNEFNLCKYKNQFKEAKRLDMDHLLEVEKLHKELEASNRSTELMEQEHLNKIQNLERQKDESDKEYERIKALFFEEESRLKCLEENNEDKPRERDELTSTINDKRNNINSLKMELKKNNLKTDKLQLNQKNEALKSEIDNFEKRHISHQNEESDILKKIEANKRMIDEKTLRNENHQNENDDLKTCLKENKQILEDACKTKLEISKKYDQSKNEQREKNCLLQLDLLKFKQDCELKMQMIKVKEERKLEDVQKLSDLQLKLKRKKELKEKQAATIGSKIVSIKNAELEVESSQKEVIDTQAEIENLKNLDETLKVNHRSQVQIIHGKAKQLEEHTRVSKNTILSEHKTKMDELTKEGQSNKTKFINEKATLMSDYRKVDKRFEKSKMEHEEKQIKLNKGNKLLAELMEAIDAMKNKPNEPEIASNTLFKIPILHPSKRCHAGSSQATKSSRDHLEDILKISFKDMEKDKETHYTPTSFRKRQKRFETPERD